MVTIKPIPRPCRGCGVGEAQQHIDDCPAVIEALNREAPTWASLWGCAPDITPEQLFGDDHAEQTVEHRVVCDECGQIQGLFHKSCDGNWVRESRAVTAWKRVGS